MICCGRGEQIWLKSDALLLSTKTEIKEEIEELLYFVLKLSVQNLHREKKIANAKRKIAKAKPIIDHISIETILHQKKESA